MKLAFSSNGFKNYDILDAITILSDIGYEGIEILLDTPHAYPPDLTSKKIEAIKETLQKTNMKISNLNAFMLYAIRDNWRPSFIEAEKEERRKRIDHTHNCIDLASQLGCKTISTEPGGQLIGVERDWANTVFIEAMEELAEHAERAGITILVEPEPDLLIETSDQFIAFKKEVPSESIALNFDIGHFYCVNEDPTYLVDKLLPYTGHYHLEDISSDRAHHHLIPGEGAINIPEVLNRIQDTGYEGYVTVELYPYQEQAIEAATQAYRYITSIMGQLQTK
ncbi:sugar phosphate isomerase/epimerase [Virgibacillus sp. NKC19-16]|uniref:sugar phosphate isomerase/epimerase family protein n=1 Tax=Virgibacillus salidurans TaxID=2831673 RepID=UPI001F325240|nr:sugar phosphate isomerase/epimerase family protein [Virgibacillus sp. NKC19-16]UJL45758.1 sugar phosphate isomerase/epimerase [Virgibacillus sp. NKC19-16]